ncbi:PH domain-containing protein [Aspergillus clavatus NRRL 1]|uniref:PH domain protein n=1 Tax=Aspergillus clavatus (strain ATCC 1007 / CBS 513.65 / DSM 816 / NCTC 3887 / NRRL 1 / QM 1276 / 107) TaxID=344612 RepID=A1CBG1_ASPCL|nr:PH domain protein [Aspergillus clavatus NRRL 1]EAW13079.1 PH domain protein [Aspergillus clavatus NRRL 1]
MNQVLADTIPPVSEAHTKGPSIHFPDGTVQQSTPFRPIQAAPIYRSGHVNLDTFSPVNENGSFEFDRVLKTGKVYRRVKHKHAFRASWKPAYLVLRPNLLSVYKDEEATRLRASITLSEVTAVAPVRSPRSSRQYVFGIFSPSKNYRFQASSEKDADDWIQRIRAETRMDEEEEAFLALSQKRNIPATKAQHIDDTTDHSDFDYPVRASSPELGRGLSPGRYSNRFGSLQDHSGNEITSYSEWSDGPSSSTNVHLKARSSIPNLTTPQAPPLPRDNSRHHDLGILRDPERVIYNGYLQCLRIKGAVRQWKRLWVVLRPKSLGFYKDDQVWAASVLRHEKLTGDEQEYSAIKIIPMSQVIEAAEVDPLSRSKKFCLQIIAEDKSYRLCAPDEESLAKWLGSLKSILIARKKLEPASAVTASAAP